MGGKCVAEYKYDGERIQAHKKGNEVVLFSRRLEKISDHYPDAIKLIRKQVKAKEAILEGECVAVDIDTGEMRPFQELMHRRRKYRIEEAMGQYPVSLFMFDALYVDNKDLTNQSFVNRRKALEEIIDVADNITLAKQKKVTNLDEFESFFEEAVENGCEGLVCKSTSENSVYQAGARGWLWIKYKRDYKSEMSDTVDLVIVGAFRGRGKRAGLFGAMLLASYNEETDTFETVTKCGTGFTDKDLNELPDILKKHAIQRKHPRVVSKIEPDVWFEPSVVLEVKGAEITLSPIHACAKGQIPKHRESGLAIRFPRFTGHYRSDKTPEEATTSKEIKEMYFTQYRQIENVKPLA
jgi:DNA ligase 1